MENIEQMAEFKTSPEGILFNCQIDRPTKKYNRKVGTYFVGLRLHNKEEAKTLMDEMHGVQQYYAQVNNITDEVLLPLPYFDTAKMGMNNGIEFNPFRMNSCGWSYKTNNVFMNIPRVYDAEGKELSHAKFKDCRDKEFMGRVFYGIEGYNNQEGIGVILRLRGVQINYETPHNQIAV